MTERDLQPSEALRVATAIAKGDAVDWTAAGRSTSSRVLTALQALDKVAALAGGIPDSWGRASIAGELGTGASGTVYAARDSELGIDIALKVVRRRLGDATRLEAALNEARLLAQVTHPNVVRVFWAEAMATEVGVAMELVDGHTLGQILGQRGPLGLEETIGIGIDLCRALAAVHDAGLVHGDIKASNVMRTVTGRTVLMDFGIGRDLKVQHPAPQGWVGTPLYLAPEVFAGAPASRASDIYSIGVLLYHLVSSSYPVEGRDAIDVERHHAAGRPRMPLRTRRPDLPTAFLAVVDRALALRPEDRHRTAGEFEAALLDARPSGGRRMPWPLLLGTAAAVGLVGVALLTTPWTRDAGTDIPSGAAPSTATTSGLLSAAPVSAPESYRIDVALYRHEGDAEVRLSPGARVSLGDELSLRVQASVPVHAYVVNEDDRNASYLLFPLPGQQLANPLPAGRRHEIPGIVDGQRVRWTVNSVGHREHFLVFVSPEALSPALARVFASLPRPTLGAPLLAHSLSPEQTNALRGVGGLAKAPASQPTRRLSDEFAVALPGSEETARGVWVRQLTLENQRK